MLFYRSVRYLIGHQASFLNYQSSSETKIKGAGSFLCKKVMEEFAKNINQDFYILPSPIHELILVPDDGSYRSADLKKMVKEVNLRCRRSKNFIFYIEIATGNILVAIK